MSSESNIYKTKSAADLEMRAEHILLQSTLASQSCCHCFKSNKPPEATYMYERFDCSLRHRLPKMLPMLSPPPYTPSYKRASSSTQRVERHDDYRCTISKQHYGATIVNISIHLHKHLELDRIPCWRIRRKLVALDQPICEHRRTSDPAFFRAVRRRTNSMCISFGSREYLPFFGRWRDRSRIWQCTEDGCNMEAWITQDRDTGKIRLHAKTYYVGELSEENANSLEEVKMRAEEGGGLSIE